MEAAVCTGQPDVLRALLDGSNENAEKTALQLIITQRELSCLMVFMQYCEGKASYFWFCEEQPLYLAIIGGWDEGVAFLITHTSTTEKVLQSLLLHIMRHLPKLVLLPVFTLLIQALPAIPFDLPAMACLEGHCVALEFFWQHGSDMLLPGDYRIPLLDMACLGAFLKQHLPSSLDTVVWVLDHGVPPCFRWQQKFLTEIGLNAQHLICQRRWRDVFFKISDTGHQATWVTLLAAQRRMFELPTELWQHIFSFWKCSDFVYSQQRAVTPAPIVEGTTSSFIFTYCNTMMNTLATVERND